MGKQQTLLVYLVPWTEYLERVAHMKYGAEYIAQYIEVPDNPADAWIRGYGTPVWTLVAYLRVVEGDANRVAEDYELPREAVYAALIYYAYDPRLIEAKITLNTA